MLSRFIYKFHTLRDRFVLAVPPRAENPYLTHLPILLTAATWRPLTSILEFGCGEVSTKAFLDRKCFPSLVHLESYENDAAWAESLRSQVGHDSRLDLRLVDGPIAAAVEKIDLERFDLIFIDDSTTAELRSATIRAVASKKPQRAFVVIHDFECLAYRNAASSFQRQFRFAGQNPNTGVVWNGHQLRKSELQSLDCRMRKIGELPDAASWVDALH